MVENRYSQTFAKHLHTCMFNTMALLSARLRRAVVILCASLHASLCLLEMLRDRKMQNRACVSSEAVSSGAYVKNRILHPPRPKYMYQEIVWFNSVSLFLLFLAKWHEPLPFTLLNPTPTPTPQPRHSVLEKLKFSPTENNSPSLAG